MVPFFPFFGSRFPYKVTAAKRVLVAKWLLGYPRVGVLGLIGI